MDNETKKTILLVEVVEDEKSIQSALMEKCTKEGWQVIGANNGAVGLSIALEKKPDVIILDLVMPVMGGLEMLEKLRASGEWGKNASVIVLTNLSPDEEITRIIARNEPSYYFIKTDWKIDDVIDKVREVGTSISSDSQ